jgi:hypothetical protein
MKKKKGLTDVTVSQAGHPDGPSGQRRGRAVLRRDPRRAIRYLHLAGEIATQRSAAREAVGDPLETREGKGR